jgi:hypothetical protein
MNQGRWLVAFCLAALLGVSAAQAQVTPADAAAKPLLKTTFTDNDVNGWKTFGSSAKTSVVKDETRSGTDKNVLQYDYTIAKGEMSALFLTVNENEITDAHSFRFTVKADYPTTLVAALQEKDGGRYIAMFHVPGGKWQNVVLSPTDFVLAQDKTDPPDPDGKLDLDQVEGAGIADVSQFFAQTGDPGLSQLFNIRAGSHSIWLGDFTVSRQPVPGALSQSDARLDSFAEPQIGWLTVGSVELASVNGKPLTGQGISAAYHQSADSIVGLIRPFTQGKLEGKTDIKITLASDKQVSIVVQLEERDGGKYNTMVTVPGGNVPTSFTVKFADLKPANDSKDENNTFDPEKVYQILLIDLSGMLNKADGQNTLYIGDIRAE